MRFAEISCHCSVGASSPPVVEFTVTNTIKHVQVARSWCMEVALDRSVWHSMGMASNGLTRAMIVNTIKWVDDFVFGSTEKIR